jgi:hypothetical protein
MTTRLPALIGLCVVCLFLTPQAMGVVDFEKTPAGGIPVDNATLGLNDVYLDDGVGVTFGFDDTGDGVTDTEAVFEVVGGSDPIDGFQTNSGSDTAAAGFGAQLGQYFLRSPGGLTGGTFGTFVIDYDPMGTTIVAADGEIWDIDGFSVNETERYLVRAYDSNDNLLDSIESPEGTAPESPLGGEPWKFQFSGLTAGIDRITIEFTGSKTNRIGLAFNNFFPRGSNFNPGGIIPEPSTFVLGILGLGFVSLGTWRRRFGPGRTA